MRLLNLTAVLVLGCSFEPAASPSSLADLGPVDLGSEDTAVVDSAVDMREQLRDLGGRDDGADATPSDMAAVDLGAPDSDLGPPVPDGVTTVERGALTLHTTLPHLVDDCIPGATSCDDLDGDTLVDAWEALVLDRFRPTLVFDEEEKLFTEPDSVVAFVGRVAPTRRADRITVWLPILYDRDYGTCGSLSAHPGDSERVVLLLNVEPGTVSIDRAYTAAHENTPNDHSMTFAGAELAQLEYDESAPNAARWVVYPSKNKHATYITRAVCEGISPIPCFSEACGPDGVNAADYTLLPAVENVGEPNMPLFDDLTPLGFAGESAWADQSFCGGHGGAGCPGAVREKLTTNPFQ